MCMIFYTLTAVQENVKDRESNVQVGCSFWIDSMRSICVLEYQKIRQTESYPHFSQAQVAAAEETESVWTIIKREEQGFRQNLRCTGEGIRERQEAVSNYAVYSLI